MTQANFKPIGDRVLLRENIPDETTEGGIILAQKRPERKRDGFVVAVGEGTMTENGGMVPLPVKPGDHVHYVHAAGNDIKIDEVTYQLLTIKEIHGVYLD